MQRNTESYRRTDGQTDGRTDGQGESSIPPKHLQWVGGIMSISLNISKDLLFPKEISLCGHLEFTS